MAEADKTLLGAANNDDGTGGGGDGGGGGGGGGDDAAAKAAAEKAAADKAATDKAAADKAAADKAAADTAAKTTRDKELTDKLTAEGKSADEIKAAIDAADKAAAEAAKASQGAPEKYADFKLPEGLTLDTAGHEKFTALAKELNLSQEKAQKLIDIQSDFVQRHSKAQLESFNNTVKAWKEQTLKDLGNDSKKQLSVAAKAKVMFGSEGLTKLLDESGLGNHPEMVKFFIKIGEKISEDKLIGGGGAGGDKSKAERLYPTKK